MNGIIPWGDKKEAAYKKEKINEKCQNYLLILEIKRQEGVSSFIAEKKSAIDSEIPCSTPLRVSTLTRSRSPLDK